MRTVFDLITTEENAYQTLPITVADGYEWNMYEHIRTTLLYMNSRFLTGNNDNKPFKNIIRPILNLQHRAEGFDVKDIVLFIDDADDYYKSFLVKKFHDRWARQNNIDTFIDDMVESYIDFGGALIKKVPGQTAPEVVPWQRIAFCDQTDILSGPIAEKHFYSPDELKDMEKKGWGSESNGATGTIDEVIVLAQKYKMDNNGQQSKTPGKYIKAYEIHGVFPNEWLEDQTDDEASETPEEEAQEQKFSLQLHIVTFYIDESSKRKYITLFRKKEGESPYKLVLRDKVYGRALGFGGAEELFEPQVWVNDHQIRIKALLDAASKVIFQTTDPAVANRNKTSDMENGEIIVLATDTRLEQVNTQPVNITLFENAVKDWEVHAQQMGAANDSIMGEKPSTGTPFKLQELVTQEAHSLHEYRKGKLATFLDEVYRDWIIPELAAEIAKDQTFLSELSLDELQNVADSLVACQTNYYIKEKILSGQEIQPQDVQTYGQQVRDQFMKGGNKRFIQILEGELKDAPIEVQVDIAGKQKDLSGYTDKLVNIFRQLISAPQILDDPRMAKIFNQILESSGLSPIDFSQKPQPQNNGPANKVSESISFKDLPPDGQVQMAQQAGIKIAPPSPPAKSALPLSKQTVAIK